MPVFSKRSKQHLATVHADLRRVFEHVVLGFDCTVLEGWRGQARQDELFDTGLSRVKWPNSRHNDPLAHVSPGIGRVCAVDVAPWPIQWHNKHRFYYFAGYVMACAHALGVQLRWGGDWDSDHDFKDQSFYDLAHFELKGVPSGGDDGSSDPDDGGRAA